VQTTYTGLRLDETAKTSEIQTLQSKYGLTQVRTYIGVQAKKERLKAEVSTAGTLHVAAPLILDNAVPMYSFLALSADHDHDEGLLRLSEITNLISKARIVVLPRVFRANSQSGNALIALSWSWFVAGTPTIVVNRMYIGK